MSLIKHLEENINKPVSYEYAISLGKAYKTKNGGKPKVDTITRRLRDLVEDGKLETIRIGNVITGYIPWDKEYVYDHYQDKLREYHQQQEVVMDDSGDDAFEEWFWELDELPSLSTLNQFT